MLTQGHSFFAHLRDVTFGGGKFVAVGDLGATAQSTDGLTWTFNFTPTDENLYAVTQFGSQFIATGGDGGIYTSPNADVWTPRASGVTTPLTGVAASSSLAVAVGRKKVVTSTDGVTWTAANFTNTSVDLITVAFGNNVFAALTHGSGTASTYSSTNGTTWNTTSANWSSPMMRTIRFLGTRFVAAGMQKASDMGASPPFSNTLLYTSGFDFSAVTGPATGTVAAMGQWGNLATSLDGGAYVERVPASDGQIWGAAYGNGVYVAVGDDGRILRSTDGVNWTDIKNGGSMTYNNVAYGAGRFVAVGGNTGSYWRSLTSTDGTHWSFGQRAGTNIEFTNNEFLAAGLAGQVAFSSNGLDFKRVQTPSPWNMYAMTRGPDRYLAVGGFGELAYSFDGGAWTRADAGLGTQSYIAVKYAGGQYVMTGAGKVLTSPTGVAWTQRTLPGSPFESLMSITYAGGIYGLTGRNKTWTSSDGATWTSTAQPDFGLDGRAFHDGTRYVMSRSQNWIFTSNDFVTWSIEDGGITPAGSYHLEGGAFGGGVYAFAYEPGRIASTTNLRDFYVFNTQENANVTALWTRLDGGLSASNEYGLFLNAGASRTFAPQQEGFEFGLRHRPARNGATLVAASGKPDVFVSTNDGSTWSKLRVGVTASENIGCVVYAFNQFMAFGAKIHTSPDGLNWTTQTSSAPTCGFFANNRLVVFSNTQILYSDNGTTFVNGGAPGNKWRDLVFANGLWMAVGDNGSMTTSPDGAVWTERFLPTATVEKFNTVTAAGSRWVLGGTAGLLYTSEDGGLWTPRHAPGVELFSAAADGTDVVLGGAKGLILRVTP